MKDEDKTKAELIKELEILREERGKGVFKNITEGKQSKEELKESERKLRNIFENSTNVFYSHTPEGLLTFISPYVEDLLGYTQEEAMTKWTKFVSDNPLNEIAFKYTLKAIETGKRQPPYEMELIKKNGENIWIEAREFPEIRDGKTIAIVGSFTDITQRKKAEEKLKSMARIDSLTGCYTRNYGLELLDRQIKLSQRNKTPLSLAFLDIDYFKDINDNFGHYEGDKVLKKSVELFKSTLRVIDIICRMGGDEFLLIFPDISQKEVSLINNRLQNNLSQLNKTIKKDYSIKFSIGLSEYLPDEPKTLDELLRIADQRMYEDKKKIK